MENMIQIPEGKVSAGTGITIEIKKSEQYSAIINIFSDDNPNDPKETHFWLPNGKYDGNSVLGKPGASPA